jgi:hypothetical protein
MRALPRILLIYALAVLLASSSPIGAGQGVHRDQLLDALLPHMHFVNGQPIDVGEPAPISNGQTGNAGPALGAGAGGTATVAAEALTPVLRAFERLLAPVPSPSRLLVEDPPAPRGRIDAPPDPPPTRWS